MNSTLATSYAPLACALVIFNASSWGGEAAPEAPVAQSWLQAPAVAGSEPATAYTWDVFAPDEVRARIRAEFDRLKHVRLTEPDKTGLVFEEVAKSIGALGELLDKTPLPVVRRAFGKLEGMPGLPLRETTDPDQIKDPEARKKFERDVVVERKDREDLNNLTRTRDIFSRAVTSVSRGAHQYAEQKVISEAEGHRLIAAAQKGKFAPNVVDFGP